MFIGGFAVGFAFSWKLTLVIFSIVPLIGRVQPFGVLGCSILIAVLRCFRCWRCDDGQIGWGRQLGWQQYDFLCLGLEYESSQLACWAEFYAKAGAIADETIRMIRTVIAFDTQEVEEARYRKELTTATKEGMRAGKFQGIGMGFTFVSLKFAKLLSTHPNHSWFVGCHVPFL